LIALIIVVSYVVVGAIVGLESSMLLIIKMLEVSKCSSSKP